MPKRRDTLTLDLFRDWEPPKVAVSLPAGTVRGGTLATQIARAVSHALSECDQSRYEIAKAMSEYLGQDVSKNMLDAYASQARGEHKITLERLIALIEVTKQYGLLGFIAKNFDLIVVPKKYSDLIDLHFIDEQMKFLEQRKNAGLARWKVSK